MRKRNLYDFDRKKLYKEVWKEPMTKVAGRYNISNVGLKKICIKMKIPVPGVGHWVKVKSGIKIERLPLPKYNGPELATRPQMNDLFDKLEPKITEFDEKHKF